MFKLTPTGVLATLHNFAAYGDGPDNSDGINPVRGLTLGKDGNFYGTTQNGGVNGGGTVFRITSTGTLTTLYALSTNAGYEPTAPVVQDGDGNFLRDDVVRRHGQCRHDLQAHGRRRLQHVV